MRLPSSPGYGGKSSPSASRATGARPLQILDVNLRLALVIVERLLLLRQVGNRSDAKAALDEPVRGLRRQHEQLRQLELARALLDLAHQRRAVTLAPKIGMDRECRQLAQALGREGVQRRAADDVIVVLGHDETLDLAFEPLA